MDKLRGLFPDNHLNLQIGELRKPFEYALENGVRYVVILGDVADKSRLSEEAQISLFNLLKSYDGKLKVYVILGNHDVHSNGLHSLQLFSEFYKKGVFKTIHIVDTPKQKKIAGVAVNFLPFPESTPIKDKRGYKTVNFAHIERPGALRDNGSKIQKDHGIKQKGKDVWVIGHLHTPQTVGLSYYAGTMYQQNFGEGHTKGFLHCKFKIKNGKLKHNIRFVENDPKFKLFNLIVESESDLEQISSNPLYKYKLFLKAGVRLPNNIAEQYPNITNTLGFKNKKDLEFLEAEDEEDDEQVNASSFGLTDNLERFVREKHKLKPKKVRRILDLADRIIEKAKVEKLIQVE